MIHSKLIELLQIMSPWKTKERNDVIRFLESPFFNYGFDSNVKKLFDALIKEKTNTNFDEFDAKTLISRFNVDKNDTIDEDTAKKKLNYICYDLYELLKIYIHLTTNRHFNDKSAIELSVARYYRENLHKEKRLEKISNSFKKEDNNSINNNDEKDFTSKIIKSLDRANDYLNNTLLHDFSFYLNQYLISEEYFLINSLQNFSTSGNALIELNKQLDKLYGVIKMEYLTLLNYQNSFLKGITEEQLKFANLIVKHITEEDYPKDELIRIYLLCNQVTSVENIKKDVENKIGEELKELLSNEAILKKIPITKLRDIFTYERRYWVAKHIYLLDKDYYATKVLEVIKRQINMEALFDEGRIHHITFHVYISFALKLGKMDEATEILEKYTAKNLFGITNKEATIIYTLFQYESWLDIPEKDFEIIANELKRTKFKNDNHKVAAKILLVKIYYIYKDLGSKVEEAEKKIIEGTNFEKAIAVLKMTAKRTNFQPQVQKTVTNFANDLNNLYDYREKFNSRLWARELNNQNAFINFVEQNQKEPLFAQREWFNKQINIIGKKYIIGWKDI